VSVLITRCHHSPELSRADGVPQKIHTPFDFQWYDFDEDSRVFDGDLWMKDFPGRFSQNVVDFKILADILDRERRYDRTHSD
jgi:hypothetical protein